MIARLNAVLLVTKSCTEGSCRDPWLYLQPQNSNKRISSLKEAMDPRYDGFFASIPLVHFSECLNYQSQPVEEPFWPPSAAQGLGMRYRQSTDNFVSTDEGDKTVAWNGKLQGGWEQRHVTIGEIMKTAQYLTEEELSGVTRNATDQDTKRLFKWT